MAWSTSRFHISISGWNVPIAKKLPTLPVQWEMNLNNRFRDTLIINPDTDHLGDHSPSRPYIVEMKELENHDEHRGYLHLPRRCAFAWHCAPGEIHLSSEEKWKTPKWRNLTRNSCANNRVRIFDHFIFVLKIERKGIGLGRGVRWHKHYLNDAHRIRRARRVL